MKNIYFITSNTGKLIEAKKKFSELHIELIQKNIGYPEIQANSLEEVASFGVKYILKKFKHPFILEDAGLFIESLNGFPGIFSAYVYHTIGCEGVLKIMNNNKTNRSAIFKSVYAYGKSNCRPQLFIGDCKGTISNRKRGNNGFGYDPIFIPNGEKKTFAEMSIDEKNIFSHRGNALNKLLEFLKEN